MPVVHVEHHLRRGLPVPPGAGPERLTSTDCCACGRRASWWPAGRPPTAGAPNSSTACRTGRPCVRSLRRIPTIASGAWTAYVPRDFETFVDPWEAEPPVVLDGSRPASIVEGPTADRDMAQLALVELRGAGRIVFGGFLPGGSTLAVARTPDPDEATGWLAESGCWKAADLAVRPWLYVI